MTRVTIEQAEAALQQARVAANRAIGLFRDEGVIPSDELTDLVAAAREAGEIATATQLEPELARLRDIAGRAGRITVQDNFATNDLTIEFRIDAYILRLAKDPIEVFSRTIDEAFKQLTSRKEHLR